MIARLKSSANICDQYPSLISEIYYLIVNTPLFISNLTPAVATPVNQTIKPKHPTLQVSEDLESTLLLVCKGKEELVTSSSSSL